MLCISEYARICKVLPRVWERSTRRGNERGQQQRSQRFACLKFGLFGLFFPPEQCFSLTTIQPKQCFQPVSAKVQSSERGHTDKGQVATQAI